MGNEHSSGVDGASLDSNGAENRDADRSIPSNIEDVSAPNSTDEASEPNLKLTQEVVVANTSISLEDHEIKNDNKILGSSPDIITTSKTEIPGQKSGENIRIRTLETPATETTLEVTTNLRPTTAVETPASTNVPVAPKTTTQKTTAKNPKRTHNQSQHFSEGALRGANEINREKDIVRDPILEAVAAGSVVRRAKEERMSRKRTQTRNRLPSSGVRNRASGENNEWKNSLRFLARTAASTAKTVARVAAPVVMDAKHVVVSSATEFAQDVRTEWKKESEIHATIAAKGGLMVDSIDNLGSQNQNDTSGKVIPVQSDKETDSNESGKQMLAKQTFTSKTDTANAIPMPSSDDVTTSENALTLVPTDSEFQLSQNAKEEDDNGDDDIDTPDSGKEGVPKKCIYEELQIMEENFETQLETVQSQIEVLASPKEERKDGEEDEPRITMLLPEEDFSKHDFSENTTEITFLDKDSAEKQSTSIEPIDMDLLSKSVDESFVTTEENLNLDESEIAFDESESQKSRGQTKESRSYNNSEVEKQNVSIDCDALVEVIETRDAHSHEEKLPNEKACSNENDLTRLDPTQGEEITMDNEGCNSETQDQETNSSQEKKIRTRSGRVVKPVRRLVDGFDTSIGGENQYGATEKQIDEVEEHSILAGDSIADEDHPKEAVENGEGLDQISAPLSTENQDLLVDRESKLNAGIGLSIKDGNEDKDSDSKTNAHIMETPREKETKQAKDSPGEMIQTRTAKSGLFSLREDSLYQREEAIDMKDTTLGDESNLRKKFEEERYEEQSRSYFIQSLKDHGLIDRQNIVKFVVTKLTGLEISVERKRNEFGLLETRHECCVPDSIFDHQLHDVSEDKSSMSSLSSPPEIESSTTEHSKDLLAESRDEDDQIFSIFDCIPGKQEVSEETYVDKCSSEGRMVRNDEKRTSILRQGSGGSINGSSCSFSTQQRSSRSNPFLPRRSSRRLRRQGSRLSLSMSNTLSTRSPLTTPIENRSTVDDKCNIDGSQADQRGQMVGWDAHVIEGNFSVVPDTEDMTEAYERSGPFFETLMAISTLENTEFLKEFPCRKCTEVPEPIASLIWRQLIANWKHSESFKAMSAKLHPTRLANVGIGSGFLNTGDDSLSSMTTIQFQSKTGNVVFSNDFMTSDTYKLLQYTRAVRPSTNNGERLFLTDYLCDIGPTTKMSVTDAASIVPLRHCFSNTEQGAEDTSHPSIERIQDEARTNLPVLQNIMNKIVNNSTHNSSPFSEIECDTIHSSFGIKDYRSIRNKARRKYGEDVLQVKDVLRGQITFPDEGSLVCGLFCLHTLVGLRDTPGSKEHISMPCFEIVRLKNLFRTSDVAKDCTTPLPTGYRHILINLRFESGFIAELQFQLAQLFGVMDTGGYLLHQSLVSYEYENSWAQFSNRGRKDMTKMDDHKVFDVTPTGFVSSILSSSDPTLPSCKPDHRVGSSSLLQASAQPGLKNPHQKAEEQESKSTPPVSIAALAAQAALKKSIKKVEAQESESPPMGGIAALAAEAALKKSIQKVEEQEPKSIPPVSIAALAAQAALKKSTQKVEEQEPKSIPPGSIAALAAQAALKKSTQKVEEQEPKSIPPVSIAALAAQAALKKSTQKVEEQEPKSIPPGSIAALAAQAALKKSTQKVEEQESESPPMGDISALAAQAELKKSTQKVEEQEPKSIPPGSIAALAAQAALKKSTQKVEEQESESPPMGDISALAAQAELKKSTLQEDQKETEDLPVGIAALAAQAELKKSTQQEDQKETEDLPVGIAALAAQAALKKSTQQKDQKETKDGGKQKLAASLGPLEYETTGSIDNSKPVEKGPSSRRGTFEPVRSFGGLQKSPRHGIGGLAAQIKQAQEDGEHSSNSEESMSQEENQNDDMKAGKPHKLSRENFLRTESDPGGVDRSIANENSAPPPGGIAALAAQAALKRDKAKEKEKEAREEVAGPPPGGIAALAAQAALKRDKAKEKEAREEVAGPPPGGIAALAAQAALKRDKAKEKEAREEVAGPPPGGIAALAAQAALKRDKAKEKEAREEVAGPPPGGIAALAAQAALKRGKAKEKEAREEVAGPPPGGIAALAAQAALKRDKAKEKEAREEVAGPPPGGIAALAAQAALKRDKAKEKEKEAREEVAGPPPGGIAALAAQAALKRDKAKEKEKEAREEVAGPPPGGIAALAAQAALKRDKAKEKEAREEVAGPPPGGIAALAAQAALKRDKAKEKEAREEVAGPPPGGIAALAAQAALKRDKAKEKEKEAREEVAGPPPGGIAALAAQAALKRDKAKEKEKEAREEVAGPPPGGIAALAAQAALKRHKAKEKEEEAREEVAGPPPGGIAALAAQAALKRHKFKGRPEGESEMSPTEGIARIPAVASSKKSKEKIPQLSTDSTAEGTAARQKASANSGEEMMAQSSLISEGLNLRHYSMEEALPAVLNAGVREATSNPRDLASLYCLYILTLAIKKNRITLQAQDYETPPPTLSSFSRKLLMTSLLISNQANSTGMIGWLECGASSLFERGPSLPLEVMEQLSCSMAAENDWEKASDVLSSLVLRCRQNLPPCHPQTISSMLDLAGAQSKAKNFDFAKSIISEALHLVSSYLCEAESFFFDQFYLVLDHESHLKWDQVVTFDDSVDIISALQEFSKDLKQGLSRNFLKFLGKHHRITLLNNSIVGDSFSVLANCLSAGEPPVHTNTFQPSFNKTKGESNRGPASRRYWSLAYKHYELSFRGWIALESLIHPNAATLTFSIARCLRELGKTAQAIKILETLASCLEQKLDDEISQKAKASEANLDSSVEQNTIRIPLNDSTSLPPFKTSFFPCGRRGEGRCLLPTLSLNANQDPDGITDSTSCEREQTAVVCFWTMAVLIAEESPDERGRSRALSLLHTASMAIRRILSRLPESGHSASSDQTRLVCLDLYNRIETEALDLFEPLARIPQAERFEQTDQQTEHLKKNPSSPRRRKHATPWEISTPMREKRQWTSPRRNRKHAKQSTGTKGNVILSNVSRDRAKVE